MILCHLSKKDFISIIDKKIFIYYNIYNNVKELIIIKNIILFKAILSYIILNNDYKKKKQKYFEELMKNLELFDYQKEYIKILLKEKRGYKYLV